MALKGPPCVFCLYRYTFPIAAICVEFLVLNIEDVHFLEAGNFQCLKLGHGFCIIEIFFVYMLYKLF